MDRRKSIIINGDIMSIPESVKKSYNSVKEFENFDLIIDLLKESSSIFEIINAFGHVTPQTSIGNKWFIILNWIQTGQEPS